MADLPPLQLAVRAGFMGIYPYNRIGDGPIGAGGVREAKTPKLGKRIRAAKGLRRIIVGTLDHLTSNIAPTLRGDTEGVHQMRIALRSLRAALELFESRLDAVAVRGLETELKALGSLFGRARDWDVFCLETLPAAIIALPSVQFRGLQEAAEGERQIANAAIIASLRGRHFTAVIVSLANWIEKVAGNHGASGDDSKGERLAALAPSLLGRVAAKAKKRGHHAGRLSVEARHNFRKSLDKLCDDVKFFTRLFPGRQLKRYRDRCEDLQAILGLANDADVAQGLALSLVTDRRQDLAEPADALIVWSKQRSRRTLRGLKTALNDFRAVPAFWR
jgi:CHAD domain-containing protein